MYTILKRTTPVLLIAAFACSFMHVPFYQTNFSGTWVLNESKSEMGQFGGRGIARKIVVAQKADAVTFSKTATNFNNEEATTDETLTFDGKESETTVFGAAKKKSTLKWSADGSGFTVNYNIAFERNGQTFDLKGVETWSLGADGKTLLLQTTFTSPQGETITKVLYDKQ
jgi:hypothetical protein